MSSLCGQLELDDSLEQPPDQLLSVRSLANNQKVLEVVEDVPCDQLLAEFTGKIMLRNEFNKENIVSKRYVNSIALW